MRLTRVHVEGALAAGQRLVLPDRAAEHLVRVLRLREGDACVLFNGDGHDYDARLMKCDKREAIAEIASSRSIDNESPLRITLLQGIARGEKMDLILQKATELGVCGIVPVDAERTEVRLEGERLRKRVAHWRNVLIAACEQSGRARVPELSDPIAVADAARHLEADSMKLTLDPQGTSGLRELSLEPGTGITLAIGPEGGWSPRDRDALAAAGFTGLRLGPRVLRTETAGLAAIAALQGLHGDLAG